jgi:cyclopropane fatty-acyl-phospholipid synthase-like methyltransferase
LRYYELDLLPFSQACENNKPYILNVLREVFADRHRVLEIGSGTGQHACHFAEHLPWIEWQPSDLPENLPQLRPRCALYAGQNLLPALALDVRDRPWRLPIPDALFTANSLHIMAFTAVQDFFAALAEGAPDDAVLTIYGPFNYHGEYTSASNAQFDQWLLQRDPASGIRDFEAVNALAEAAGFSLQRDHAMPANNRLLVWRREGR